MEKLEENLEDISSVALLSPACLLGFLINIAWLVMCKRVGSDWLVDRWGREDSVWCLDWDKERQLTMIVFGVWRLTGDKVSANMKLINLFRGETFLKFSNSNYKYLVK